MIFKRLNEKVILDFSDFNDLKNDENIDNILEHLKESFNSEEVFDNNIELIKDCIINFRGHADTDYNKFLYMLVSLDSNNKFIPLMYKLYSSNEIDLKYLDEKKYYNWAILSSFYEEESDDSIKYKARIFDIVSNPEKLSKFFQNTDNINIKDLYLNEVRVKKASLNNLKDKNGIFYQVSKWDLENDHQTDDKKVSKEKLKNLNAEKRKELGNRIKYLQNQLKKVLDDPTQWMSVFSEIEDLNDELSNLK